MKKVFRVSVLLLLTFLLVACGADNTNNAENNGNNNNNNNNNNVNEDINNNENNNNEENEDGEQVTIKYYNWDNEVTEKATAKLIERFEDENPDIKVEHVALVPGDSQATMENLGVLLASGEPVDVIHFPSFGELYEHSSKGVLHPLDEFFEEEGIDPEEEYFVNSIYEDEYYAMHYDAVTNLVVMNKEALDEARLEVPEAGWTWEDFADYAEKLTVEKDGKKQYGAYFHSWSLYKNPPAQTLMKHPFLLEDGTTNFTDPSWKYFYQYLKDMENNGYIKPYTDVLGADLSYVTEFFNEEAAMLLTGTFMIPQVGDIEANPHDFQTAFAPVPVLEEGDPTEYFMGGGALAIGESSEHKEASYKFARYVTTDLSDARLELPGLQGADIEPLIETIIEGSEEYYDIDSLMYVLTSDDIGYLDASEIVIDYGSELEEILDDGFGKYMLNDEDIDEVIDWMVEKAEEVIEKHSD